MKGDRLRGSSLLGRPRAMFFAWRFTARRLRVKPVRRPLSSSWSLGSNRLALRPPGQGGASYVGQLCRAESILLLSIALVLISTLPWVEVWFDGIDRAAIWHRRAAITGLCSLFLTSCCRRVPYGWIRETLGVVGALGLLALVVWTVPRWRSVFHASSGPPSSPCGPPRASPRACSARRLRAMADLPPPDRRIRRDRVRPRDSRCDALPRSARAAVDLRHDRRYRARVLPISRVPCPSFRRAPRLPGRARRASTTG